MAWEQLVGMIGEAVEIEKSDSTGTPTSCAVDSTPLRDGEGSKLYCPFCGLVWPDDSPAWGPYPGAY